MMSAASVKGEPQFGQNVKWIPLPLSPLPSNVFVSPSIRSAGVGTATTTENDDPVSFWHDVQWHTPWKIGSASPLYRTFPHMQPPKNLTIGYLPD